jgi:hypothetical protein
MGWPPRRVQGDMQSLVKRNYLTHVSVLSKLKTNLREQKIMIQRKCSIVVAASAALIPEAFFLFKRD